MTNLIEIGGWPEGIFLWIATASKEEELAIIKRLERWV